MFRLPSTRKLRLSLRELHILHVRAILSSKMPRKASLVEMKLCMVNLKWNVIHRDYHLVGMELSEDYLRYFRELARQIIKEK